MAFGHAVKRGGFKKDDSEIDKNVTEEVGLATRNGSEDDDFLRGDKAGTANMIDGEGGDDVIIGKGGADHLVGGDGEDDISGGAGNDLLVGGGWIDALSDSVVDSEDSFLQDDYSDDFNAEATFVENGTDTIWLYDANQAGEAGNAGDASLTSKGELSDLAEENVWFVVYEDNGVTEADTVHVSVKHNDVEYQYTWDTAEDEWVPFEDIAP